MLVFKSSYCGCCAAWIDHLREAGFSVEVTNLEDMTPAKMHFGIADIAYRLQKPLSVADLTALAAHIERTARKGSPPSQAALAGAG